VIFFYLEKNVAADPDDLLLWKLCTVQYKYCVRCLGFADEIYSIWTKLPLWAWTKKPDLDFLKKKHQNGKRYINNN
jgi:hypothetical protein